MLSAAAILTATLYLWCAIKATELRQTSRAAEVAAVHVGNDLKEQIEARILGLVRMGRRSALDNAMTRRTWEMDARLFLEHYPGYHSIVRLEPSLAARWSVSRTTGRPYDIAAGGERVRTALERARNTGQVTVSRAVTLPDGEKGFLACVPVSGAAIEGFIAGVFELEPLLNSVLDGMDLGGSSVAILDGDDRAFERRGARTVQALASTAKIDLWGNSDWQVRIVPAHVPSLLPWIAAGVGVLIAVLSALAGLLAQTAGLRARKLEQANRELQREIAERRSAQEALAAARVELEKRVEERTAELSRANQDLTAEIAERRKAEETLRASEYRYRELFDGAKDLIYVHDLNGNFVSINKAALQITGYTADEALKMNISQLVAPEDLDTVHTMVARNLGGDANATYDLAIVTKEGRRLMLEVSTHLVYRNGIPVAVQGIARDITERRRLEEQFLQSQKMEAVGRLAGGVAHDFNNLLTVIGAYSQMISDSLPDDQRLRGYAQEILWAAERAGTLTNRLLAFSRRQVVQPRIVDLNGLIVTLDNMLRRLIGEDIELKIVLEPGAGAVKADPNHLEQVIMNLAVNARDAMRTGGSLSIRTSRADLGPPAEGSPDLPPGSYIALEVIDTGAGMTPEVLAHIFEPFFTTKEAGKGTGLGLSTVYGIVKQCGGDITVRSSPGQGAHFTLYFPRAGSQDSPPAEPAPAVTLPAADRELILLVEDEYGVRKLVRKMLMQQGYRVIEASSGEEALRLAGQHDGSIHLLLSDIVMPNMSGRELAQRLCAGRPELKVLYMTGYTEDAIVQHGVLEPGVAVLNKPFLSDSLGRKIREVLDNGRA
jgi:PAS domain S-box-containing protein